MTFIKKIKQLFGKQPQTPPPLPVSDEVHLHPITTRIMTWLDDQAWTYEHKPPIGETRIHHLMLGFVDTGQEWTCVFRINESNQLVSVFGVLEDMVPVSHYVSALMAIAKANLAISHGSIELDPSDGEVRAKMAFDGEFTKISDHALACHLQAVAGLTELARSVVMMVMADDEPSQYVGDYLFDKESTPQDPYTFYLPTHTPQ